MVNLSKLLGRRVSDGFGDVQNFWIDDDVFWDKRPTKHKRGSSFKIEFKRLLECYEN
jgi:hypothetical protein